MKEFLHFVQNEIYNFFHSKSFHFVTLILLILVSVDGFFAYKMYSQELQSSLQTIEQNSDGTFKALPFLQTYTIYNSWIGGRVNQVLPMVFFYTIPIFVVITYSWSYLSEKATGYDRIMVIRLNRMTYFLGKYVSAFISGIITVLIPLLFSFLLVSCLIPAYKPDVDFDLYYQIGSVSLFRDLYYSHPLLTVFIDIVMICAFSGAWATVPLALSFIEKNKFVVLLAPYLFLMYAIASLQNAFAYHTYYETSIIDYIWLTGDVMNQSWIIYILLMAVIFFPPLIVVLERGKHADVY